MTNSPFEVPVHHTMPVHVTDGKEELVDNVTALLRELYHPGQVVMYVHVSRCMLCCVTVFAHVHFTPEDVSTYQDSLLTKL